MMNPPPNMRFSAEVVDFAITLPRRRQSLAQSTSPSTARRMNNNNNNKRGSFSSRVGGYPLHPSTRSMAASSITFSEVDSFTEDFSEATSTFDIDDNDRSDNNNDNVDDPFGEPTQVQPCMPKMPIRRKSESILSINSSSTPNLEPLLLPVEDQAPTRPTRQESVLDVASSHGRDDVSTIQQQLLLQHMQPPKKPTRQQSLADDASSAESSTLTQKIVSTLMHHHQCQKQKQNQPPPPLESLRSSSSTNESSTEPTPDYLQHDFGVAMEAQRTELAKSAAIFRSIVDLQDRTYGTLRRRTYKQCFVGSEAVDQMVEAGLVSSRTQAVELGRSLQTHLGLFAHVCHEHMFQDKYLFYHFNTPSQNNCCGDSCFTMSLHQVLEESSNSKSGGSCESISSNDPETMPNAAEDTQVRSSATSLVRISFGLKKSAAPWYALQQQKRSMTKEQEQEDDPVLEAEPTKRQHKCLVQETINRLMGRDSTCSGSEAA